MTTKNNSFDAVVIGAGMSGLAAAIRLALFGKKVCLLEKHSVAGGLNSYYKRGSRLFDVGLHALTNFMKKGEKNRPLGKILKQLRLAYEELCLKEQGHSKIIFPSVELKFSNDLELLIADIGEKFPADVDSFLNLLEKVRSHDPFRQENNFVSAKAVVREYIKNPLLLEMIFCPLMLYGSSWEHDMDFNQFVIMFKSIFLEGFSRPVGGVRRLINVLLKKYEQLGGTLKFRSAVEMIESPAGDKHQIRLTSGEILETPLVISSMGLTETLRLCKQHQGQVPGAGKITFVESILILDQKIPLTQWDSSIAFYNNAPTHQYRVPETLIDTESAVICCPDNFSDYRGDGMNGMNPGEGLLRVTFLANYEKWKTLALKSKEAYNVEKEKVFEQTLTLMKKLIPGFNSKVLFQDIFTPKTIERYTSHDNGAIYGNAQKTLSGKTPIEGVYICGNDQGFLGIVGALLSGITVANAYGLNDEKTI